MSIREHNIVAVYTDRRHAEKWKRRYKTIDAALAKATSELGSKGMPLDTITFTHAVTGKYLGFMRIHAGFRFSGERVWENDRVSQAALDDLKNLELAIGSDTASFGHINFAEH